MIGGSTDSSNIPLQLQNLIPKFADARPESQEDALGAPIEGGEPSTGGSNPFPPHAYHLPAVNVGCPEGNRTGSSQRSRGRQAVPSHVTDERKGQTEAFPASFKAPYRTIKDLESLSLLKGIPRRQVCNVSFTDIQKIECCKRASTSLTYDLLSDGYDLRLGEKGRADLKQEISRRMGLVPFFRDSCFAITRLKQANIMQLVQFAEICQCLDKALSICQAYWRDSHGRQRTNSITSAMSNDEGADPGPLRKRRKPPARRNSEEQQPLTILSLPSPATTTGESVDTTGDVLAKEEIDTPAARGASGSTAPPPRYNTRTSVGWSPKRDAYQMLHGCNSNEMDDDARGRRRRVKNHDVDTATDALSANDKEQEFRETAGPLELPPPLLDIPRSSPNQISQSSDEEIAKYRGGVDGMTPESRQATKRKRNTKTCDTWPEKPPVAASQGCCRRSALRDLLLSPEEDSRAPPSDANSSVAFGKSQPGDDAGKSRLMDVVRYCRVDDSSMIDESSSTRNNHYLPNSDSSMAPAAPAGFLQLPEVPETSQIVLRHFHPPRGLTSTAAPSYLTSSSSACGGGGGRGCRREAMSSSSSPPFLPGACGGEETREVDAIIMALAAAANERGNCEGGSNISPPASMDHSMSENGYCAPPPASSMHSDTSYAEILARMVFYWWMLAYNQVTPEDDVERRALRFFERAKISEESVEECVEILRSCVLSSCDDEPIYDPVSSATMMPHADVEASASSSSQDRQCCVTDSSPSDVRAFSDVDMEKEEDESHNAT